MTSKSSYKANVVMRRCCAGRIAHATRQAVACIVAAAMLWSPSVLGQGDGKDWFSVSRNEDYYKYRYHSTYAQAGQLLRTVENNHQRLGAERIREGRFGNAYQEFVFVLNVFPNHPEALLGLDEACRKYRAAGCNMEQRFEQAIEVNPEASGTYVIKGIYLSRSGKLPAAIESYKRAIELQPESAVANYNIGLAYAEIRDYARANEHAQKAYALGFPLPGLREKLRRAGQWKPSEAPSASSSAAGGEAATAKTPGDQPPAAAGSEKAPTQ